MTERSEPGISEPGEPGGAGGVDGTGRLVRASAVVGLGTALSRITGLGRVAALVYALGTLAVADAYNLANTTPNIVYELILGGIVSATLVPIFVDQLDRGDDEATSTVVTVAVATMVALTATAMVAAPLIFGIYTSGKDADEARELARVGVPLLRLFLPQILFYGLTAVATALLNARRSFAAPAFAPVLNNVIVITMLLAVPRVADGDLTIDEVAGDPALLGLLGVGTTAGIVAMTVVLWPALRRAGVRLRWRFDLRHEAVRRVGALSGWTIGYAVANQVALAVVLALAARREGDVSAYTYAFVFFQLPHGLFAVSIMTTFVPDLAGFANAGRWAEFARRFGLGVRLLVLVVLPAGVGYALLARPLVAALLERGALGGGDAELVAEILAAFALGLLGFSLYLFALRGFYSLADTRTPFLLNVVENGLNVVLAVAVVARLNVQGLALAYSAAYSVAAVAALIALRRRVGGLDGRRTTSAVARMAVATAVMAGAVALAAGAVGSNHGGGAVLRTVAGVAVGVVVYGAALLALRVDEVRDLAARVRRRAARGPTSVREH